MRARLKHYSHLLRLHKPVGFLLLLWPTLWALWLASAGRPPGKITAIFILGVIVMRCAGCIINDIADRQVDGFVARTKQRPLVTGVISVRAALLTFMALLSGALLLVLQLNRLTLSLAVGGALLTVIYPFLKRVTHLPQVGLGLAFAWSVPMAFAAVQQHIPTAAWVVYVAAVVWPIAYDTIYAMVDRPDDLIIGVKSSAILFGAHDTLIIAALQVAFLLLMVAVGWIFALNRYYYGSLIIALGLFIYQQRLLAAREPSACFRAFLHNQWVGLVIWLGISLSEIS